MKPHIHAQNSAKIFGGKPEDYIEIHKIMDSSKSYLGDERHRVVAHNTWFISVILPKLFGDTIKNSEGNLVSVIEIGEQHITEDLGQPFLPTIADWLTDYDAPDFAKPFKNGNRKLTEENKKLKEELDRLKKQEFIPTIYPNTPWRYPNDDGAYPKIVD